jgi:hypothetical protein
MTASTMDVFSLRDAVINDYRQFATSFTTIFAQDIREKVDLIYRQNQFWPEPLIQINPRYRPGIGIPAMVADRSLDPMWAKIFRGIDKESA